MKVLLGEDLAVAAYVSSLTGGHPFENTRGTIGILSEEGVLIGGFVFNRYTGFGIEMSIAGSGCVSRAAWQVAGDFVFGRMRCVRLQVTTRQSNKRVRKMARRFGFFFEGKARRFYGGEDGYVYSLLREEAVAKGYWKENG